MVYEPRQKKKSEFIVDNDITNSSTFDFIKGGINKKSPWSNLIALFQQQFGLGMRVYETESEMVADGNLQIDDHTIVKENYYSVYKITNIAAGAGDVTLSGGLTATQEGKASNNEWASYADIRALKSSAFRDGEILSLTNDGIAGDFVVKTGTVTDNGGTLIVFTDDSNRYAERVFNGDAVPVEWFGVTTELYPAIQTIMDLNYEVLLSAKSYTLSAPILPPSGARIRGQGQWKSYILCSSGFISVIAGTNDTYRIDRTRFNGFSIAPVDATIDNQYGIRFEAEEMSYNRWSDIRIDNFKYNFVISSRGWLNNFTYCRFSSGSTAVTGKKLIEFKDYEPGYTGSTTLSGLYFSWDFISCTIAGVAVEKGLVAEDPVEFQAVNFIGGDFECDGWQTYILAQSTKELQLGFSNIDNDGGSGFLIQSNFSDSRAMINVNGGNFNCSIVGGNSLFDYKFNFGGSNFCVTGATFNNEPNIRYINGFDNERITTAVGNFAENKNKMFSPGYLDAEVGRIQQVRDRQTLLNVAATSTAYTAFTLIADKDSEAGTDEASSVLTLRLYKDGDAASYFEEKMAILTEGVTSIKVDSIYAVSNRDAVTMSATITGSGAGTCLVQVQVTAGAGTGNYHCSLLLGTDGTYRFG